MPVAIRSIALLSFSAWLLVAQTATPSASLDATGDPVLVGAGDIATCSHEHDEETAALLEDIEGTIFTLGDNVYQKGAAKEFADCFDPSWGLFLDRIRPAPGNHDYDAAGAEPYFAYFGAAAGDPTQGYYSYDLGAWHIIVLNSNCDDVDGCDAESAQADWLRGDLADHPADCTLAYWHHPLFSSGKHGNHEMMAPLWSILDDAGADVVLSGHDHIYERFAPQDAEGGASEEGIREFVVGTGGASLYDLDTTQDNSEIRDNKTFGVLKLTLHPDGLDWEFVPVAGSTFTDSGSDSCR